MTTKINLTKLLAKKKFDTPEIPSTSASYLPLSKEGTSQEDAYSFELEERCSICGKKKAMGGELWYINDADACKNPCDCSDKNLTKR